MKKEKCEYLGNCTYLNTKLIDALDENSRKITWKTFSHNVDLVFMNEFKELHGYGRNTGLLLHKDYSVSFYSAFFRGKEYYFMKWSLIHFVFVRDIIIKKSDMI